MLHGVAGEFWCVDGDFDGDVDGLGTKAQRAGQKTADPVQERSLGGGWGANSESSLDRVGSVVVDLSPGIAASRSRDFGRIVIIRNFQDFSSAFCTGKSHAAALPNSHRAN